MTVAELEQRTREITKLRMLRLHNKDGRVVSETIVKLAHRHGTDLAGARAKLLRWVQDGDLVRRSDGGYDVIRWRP